MPARAGYAGLIPRWGRSPGEGNGSPLQCSWLGNPSLVGYGSIGLQRVGHSLATTNICSLSLEWERLSDAKTEDCLDLSVTHSTRPGLGRLAPCPLTQMTVRRSSPLAPHRRPAGSSPADPTPQFPLCSDFFVPHPPPGRLLREGTLMSPTQDGIFPGPCMQARVGICSLRTALGPSRHPGILVR